MPGLQCPCIFDLVLCKYVTRCSEYVTLCVQVYSAKIYARIKSGICNGFTIVRKDSRRVRESSRLSSREFATDSQEFARRIRDSLRPSSQEFAKDSREFAKVRAGFARVRTQVRKDSRSVRDGYASSRIEFARIRGRFTAVHGGSPPLICEWAQLRHPYVSKKYFRRYKTKVSSARGGSVGRLLEDMVVWYIYDPFNTIFMMVFQWCPFMKNRMHIHPSVFWVRVHVHQVYERAHTKSHKCL